LAGETLDQVDRRVAALRLVVVSGGQLDPERSHVWVGERIFLERLTLERVLVEASGEVD